MKTLFAFIHFLIFNYSFGQLPQFESNLTDEQIENSILKREFKESYHTVISFSQHSHWFKREEYNVFAFDGIKWSLINWSFELNKKGFPKKQKKEIKKLDENTFNSFLKYLEDVNFYSFSQDSLNLNRIEYGDGRAMVKDILDGTTDKFEIFSPSGQRVSSSHEPEILQNFVSTNQRKNFIECKRRILEILK